MAEIVHMLVGSTAHVREETAKWLDEQARLTEARTHTMSVPDLIVYSKGEYGWFIGAWQAGPPAFPELKAAMDFAKSRGCSWLMLDRDAEKISDLPSFEW